jgi:AcrR family transcriptional regulator
VTVPLPPTPEQFSADRPRVDRIRDAALKRFAAHGTVGTSLRDVADTAGVSIGLVQHHFGTKDRLIDAVDKHVAAILGANLAGASSTPTTDPVGDFGHRVVTLIAEHTDVVDYIVRALLEETPTGTLIFDALVAMGADRWQQHHADELTAPGLDLTWAALNPLLLVLGAMTLRPHLDRHLPESFTTTPQLTRWEASVNALIRRGQLRASPPPANGS